MDAANDHQRLRLVFELGSAFASRLEFDELIRLVISRCREALDVEGVSLLLLTSDRTELYFPYVLGDNPDVSRRLTELRFSADRGIAGAVLSSGRAEKIDDVQSDSRFYSEVDRRTGSTTHSLLAAPLIRGKEKLGVIEAVNRRHGAFTTADLELFEGLAVSIAVALRNAYAFTRIRHSEERLRIEVGALRRELARNDRFNEMVAASPAMDKVFRLIESAAASSIPVLIEGETGTGKELVARAIHRTSTRAEGPFIAVNCAAVPEGLLESQLFGHRRGAFTSASYDQLGLFRAAHGGVLLLDEVGEMPLAMQAKLLRVLEDEQVTAIGETRPHEVDVRVLSATNRDLLAAVGAHCFREDLYYRLAGFPIHVPPLRERSEDIPLLAACFLLRVAERHHKHLDGFTAPAIELLCRATWPGNVRQLQNEIERAVALAREGEAIDMLHLSSTLRLSHEIATQSSTDPEFEARSRSSSVRGIQASSTIKSLREARADFEVRYIKEVLERNGGNISRAAVILGISRVALQMKMKSYGLRR
jgi:Nif-specific regulatory protein